MKPLLSALISLLACYTLSAQEKLYDIMPMDSGKVVYKKTIMKDSLSKDEIFNKVKAWADNYYKFENAKEINEDIESGHLAYRGFMAVQTFYKVEFSENATYRLELRYHLEFYVEEGKCRIIMRDLYIRDPQDLMMRVITLRPIENYGKVWKKRWYEEFKKDIESIHKGITKLYLDIIESIHN